MLLAVDVGNTHTVFGVFEESRLVATWRMVSDQSKTEDELAVLVDAMFRMSNVSIRRVQQMAVACVVPPIQPILSAFAVKYLRIQPVVLGPGTRTGMPILYDNPREVGADRIANAVAGYEIYGGPLVIIDFGTATTFDAVSGKGEYLGGAIAPGILPSMENLFLRAAKLPKVEFKRQDRVIGKNTVQSIQSGTFFGYLSLAEGLVSRISAEMGETPKVIATGGFAQVILENSNLAWEVNSNLTLEGIRIIHERNKK